MFVQDYFTGDPIEDLEQLVAILKAGSAMLWGIEVQYSCVGDKRPITKAKITLDLSFGMQVLRTDDQG